MRAIKRSLKFGKNAKFNNWGLKGCSHGLRSGGYDYYVYGIKGLFNYVVDDCWGDFIIRNK